MYNGPSFAAMGGLMLVWWLLAAFVLIAWILLPFAMFGIKPLLRDLLREAKETNRLLGAQVTPRAIPVDGKSPGAI
jgi:hypothetical protein